ncbi:hypothetical protein LY78DRAFT_672466 [Colletotrichum sublineola]|nr:hypothetical protein LY78DRAFT_672466 [Colletotrichum sublineola]
MPRVLFPVQGQGEGQSQLAAVAENPKTLLPPSPCLSNALGYYVFVMVVRTSDGRLHLSIYDSIIIGGFRYPPKLRVPAWRPSAGHQDASNFKVAHDLERLSFPIDQRTALWSAHWKDTHVSVRAKWIDTDMTSSSTQHFNLPRLAVASLGSADGHGHDKEQHPTDESFPLKHVTRDILCFTTDHVYKDFLNKYKSTSDGRFSRTSAAAKLWDASAGLMCFLFGVEVFLKSRPAIESLKLLHRKQHQISLPHSDGDLGEPQVHPSDDEAKVKCRDDVSSSALMENKGSTDKSSIAPCGQEDHNDDNDDGFNNDFDGGTDGFATGSHGDAPSLLWRGIRK